MLNCFKYFLIYNFGYLSQKESSKKKLYQAFMYNFLCQNEKIFTKILELYQVFLWENVLILSHCIKTKSITHKQSALFLFLFVFLFSFFDMQRFPHLLWCHPISISSSFNSFLSALRFSNLLWQGKRLKIFL